MHPFHSIRRVAGAVIGLFAWQVAHAQSDQAPISSQDVSLQYPQALSPSFSGGSGTGNWQFCVAGYTNWNPGAGQPGGTELPSGQWVGSWSPPGCGQYQFWIARNGDSNYNTAIYGPYTLTVTQGSQYVTSQDATITEGQNGGVGFTPSYSGGQGTGGYQFCIEDWTNWSPGVGQPTGTNNLGQWVQSWVPPGPYRGQQYTFYVANNGDSNYQTSNFYGPLTLTVNGPTDGLLWDGVYNVPNPSSSGQAISFFVGYLNTGQTTYDSSYYIRCSGNGANTTAYLSSCPPNYYGDVWFSLTVPSSPGTYTYTLQAGNRWGDFGPPNYFTVTVKAGSSVSYGTPAPITYPAALSSTQLNATGSVPGTMTYYLDGSQTSAGAVPNAGSHTLTAILTPNDSADYSSSSASVTLQVLQAAQPAASLSPSGTVSINSGQSVTFTAGGGAGTGAYTWGGTAGASGTGSSKTLSFPSASGSPFTVTVYRAADQNYTQSSTASVQVSVTYVPPPSITSPGSAAAYVGGAFNYQITATGSPTSYAASGLPSGLTVNASTGAISGAPTVSGTFNATVSATNASGTGNSALTITVSAQTPSGVPAPVLNQMGLSASAQPDNSNATNLQVFKPQNP